MVKIKVDYAQVTMDFGDRWVVMVSDEQGREYSRSDVNFIEHDNAVAFRDRIKERGYLNAELWDCRVPYGTEAWLSDGMEQRTIEDERHGFI